METPGISKDVISNRMFRNAAKLWGYSDAELDNFDPMVKLLIEACALEVYLIQNQIASSQQRMLERLASLLTPDVYTGIKPSHGVIHASPIEGDCLVNPTAQFFTSKKIPSTIKSGDENSIDIFFSPAGSFRLFNADVKHIIHGGGIFKVNEDLSKELLKKLDLEGVNRSVWVGLQTDSSISNFNDISFYFDFKNLNNQEQYYHLLPYVEVFSGPQQINTRSGIVDHSTPSDGQYFNPLDEFNVSLSQQKKVKGIYSKNFITLTAENKKLPPAFFVKDFLPPELETTLDSEAVKVIKEKSYWIRFDFPPFIDWIAIEELIISTNCFPVLNRRFNSTRYRLQSSFNIIPLVSAETFLDVYTVKNLEGKLYNPNPVSKSTVDKKGTFAIRSSGVERFDIRDAREYLEYLLELLRDESNAFAAYGQDFIANTIKDLKESISLIEQKINQSLEITKSKSTFLFVKPYAENESIFVEYWSTNGKLGNQIRSGTILGIYNGAELNKNGIQLRTTTFGGDDNLTGAQLLNAYKYSLLSRDRIVTRQDIINACFLTVGKRIHKVELENGVMISQTPNEGLIRCMKVIVYLKSNVTNEEEVRLIKRELEQVLISSSSPEQRYDVKILI